MIDPAEDEGVFTRHDECRHEIAEANARAAHWERLHDNRTRELNELHSKIADLARRIGPARLPESIRRELERFARRPEPEREQLEGFDCSAGFCGGLNIAQRLTCANCDEVSTNPGQFVGDGRWVCTEYCRRELAERGSFDDLAASGGIVDAP